jgi:anti-anti-sigma factor
MSIAHYNLNSGMLTEPRLAVSSLPVIDLEQRLFKKMRRSGLLIGLSFEGEQLKLVLFGTLNRAATASFKEFVAQLFENSCYEIKVDLSGLGQISGHGLAALTWMTVQAKERKGRVQLCNLQPQVRKLFFEVGVHFMLDLSDYDLVAS